MRFGSGKTKFRKENFEVRWVDAGAEPQCPPNPAYPEGIDVDLRKGAAHSCRLELPYPARRCGYYEIICRKCGMRAAVTTAGRPDDPRSVALACKILGNN